MEDKESKFSKISSFYNLQHIFSYLTMTKTLKIIKTNKYLQSRLKINFKESYNDYIIEKLLLNKKEIKIFLKLNELEYLILNSKKIIKEQPVFLKLNTPINICGDIGGQFLNLIKIFELGGSLPNSNYLFLGNYTLNNDYPDKNSLETLFLLLAYKIKYKNNIFLLRGKGETNNESRIYGLYDECKKKYNIKIWKDLVDLFNYFPFAGLIKNKILCIPSGLSSQLKNLDQLNQIKRPYEITYDDLETDLLFGTPYPDIDYFEPPDHGYGDIFGLKAILEFKKENNINLICRGNAILIDNGFELFGNKDLVSINSIPYTAQSKSEINNNGAIMLVNNDLTYSFITIYSTINFTLLFNKIKYFLSLIFN